VIISVLGLLALISPRFFGGRLRRFGDVRLRQAIVLPIALFAQVVIIELIPEANHAALSAVHVATYVAAGWFVWVNRAIPGLWIVSLGAASNGITIAVNGGTLPASRSALNTAGIHPKPEEFLNSGVLAHPHLGFLGDVFAIPERFPLANVFSVGDALIVIGVFWAAQRICGSRLAPVWRAPADKSVTPSADDTATPTDEPVVPAPAAGDVPLKELKETA
jgi:Family of unknown function (DUF5317)